MAYKGKFRPKNRNKYIGDASSVTYRSLWERNAFRWCDSSKRVSKWSSEEVVVPYKFRVDNKWHRYFVDLLVYMDGEVYLVEIKPDKETRPPKQPKRKTKRYINEVTTYIKNEDKWAAAKHYAEKRGWKFVIWTEHTLTSMGIKLLKG